ncbi:MAG: aspartate--tRNA ligase [Lentisphaerae bacterium]|jgi:aspartyl-tRNA synthetase|nr:aspartate--tRNA ligase [Lentisphaerota bacterium]
MNTYRTHNCNELREADVGAVVKLSGWIFRKRDHGGILFIDLRDHYGFTQLVINPELPFFDTFSRLRVESVITVEGRVAIREGGANNDIPTGAIEIVVTACQVESVAEPLPVQVDGDEESYEDLRLKYRYIDLRRPALHKNIVLRSQVIAHLRHEMTAKGFNEFQTPILTSSSPEGARDYLVPSRVHHGSFYALPQAPQIFKQLLMVSGFDRYFQIAPCFRDEDARADRSPGEFYQLDMEMSFVTQDEIFAVVEDVLHSTFTKFSTKKTDPAPWVRIPYREAMLKYGSDKPDLRIPIEMVDVSDLFSNSGFNAFAGAVKNGAAVRAIPVKNIGERSRSFYDKLTEFAKSAGAKGLAYLVWETDTVKGTIQKFLTADELAALADTCGISSGDAIFLVCDEPSKAAKIGGEIRIKLGRDLNLINPDTFKFCWIVDFPMFEEDPETGAIIFSHNPFSMPQGGMEALQNKPPLDILAYQYDVVCNGVELSSGAIRNHLPEVMYKAFEIAGYGPQAVETQFGCLLNAFKYGAPPHGGIAPGVDRMVMLLADADNIREVIAFPMNQKAQDMMMGAPARVSEAQLRELNIKICEKTAKGDNEV